MALSEKTVNALVEAFPAYVAPLNAVPGYAIGPKYPSPGYVVNPHKRIPAGLEIALAMNNGSTLSKGAMQALTDSCGDNKSPARIQSWIQGLSPLNERDQQLLEGMIPAYKEGKTSFAVEILSKVAGGYVAPGSYNPNPGNSRPLPDGNYSAGRQIVIAPTVVPSAAPAIASFKAGSYAGNIQVALSSATSGATMYYTLDGSTPTTASDVVNGPVNVGTSLTLKVLVVAAHFQNTLSSYAYVITGSAVATELIWTTQPPTAAHTVAFSPQPVVAIKDATGATITTGPDATATITLSITHSSGPQGVLGGTVSMAAVAGVANFSGKGLNISLAGTYILKAVKSATSASGSFSAESAPVVIS
jgi:hypothetical protein